MKVFNGVAKWIVSFAVGFICRFTGYHFFIAQTRDYHILIAPYPSGSSRFYQRSDRPIVFPWDFCYRGNTLIIDRQLDRSPDH